MNITPRDGHWIVRLCRWNVGSSYPETLVDFEILASEGESSLSLAHRACLAMEHEIERRQAELLDELVR